MMYKILCVLGSQYLQISEFYVIRNCVNGGFAVTVWHSIFFKFNFLNAVLGAFTEKFEQALNILL